MNFYTLQLDGRELDTKGVYKIKITLGVALLYQQR